MSDTALTTTIQTRDGQTVTPDQALALNTKRLGFVQRLLGERLKLDRHADLAKLVANCTDKVRLATLQVMRSAKMLAISIANLGPEAYAYADIGCAEAAKLAGLFEKPDYSTPPASWSKDYKVPELFIPLPQARQNYAAWKADKEKERADKEKEQKARADKERAEREQAEAERNRQAADTESDADFLMSLADSNVVATVEKKVAERQVKEAEQQKQYEAYLAQVKEFFSNGLIGWLTVRGYKHPKGQRAYVSDKEDKVLSMRNMARLLDAPDDTEVYSMVPGSTYKGKLGDTWKRNESDENEKPKSCWMAVTFQCKLTTEDGGQMMNGSEQATDRGFVILHSREVSLLKQVAQERGILKWGDQDSETKFWKSYHVQAIRFTKDGEVKGAAAYAADTLAGKNKNRRSSDSSDDTPGVLRAESTEEELNEALRQPRTPPDAKPAADATKGDRKPTTRRGGTRRNKGSEASKPAATPDAKESAAGEVPLGANPATKDIPGDHVAEDVSTAFADPDSDTSVGAHIALKLGLNLPSGRDE